MTLCNKPWSFEQWRVEADGRGGVSGFMAETGDVRLSWDVQRNSNRKKKRHSFLSNTKISSKLMKNSSLYSIKGTPGYKNKLIWIDSQWLVKTNGAIVFFIGKLRRKFLPDQFWSCLSFASLSVPSGIALSPAFWSCGPKLRPLYYCDMKLCGETVGR